MTAPLLGLIGKKRTGKDTFAGTLIERHAYARIALADPLREAALALDPIVGTFPLQSDGVVRVREWRLSDVVEELGWEKAKDYIPEVRRTLQRLGTESIRSLDDRFWIRTAFQRIDTLREAGTPVVVTDVRYPNEADAIKAAGGYLVRIVRDLPDDGDAHASEKAMDDYREDLRIGNNGTREELAFLAYAVGRDLKYMDAVRTA
ncbi:deoxynucleoside monophosphate kinase [Arthrobacter phage Adumb2043]|uniref:Deoxynucleoside monophosphate kinase n=1 Tax=Arthrobacter phage Adumb2043 TaxID=2776851 RepID=A0A7M1CLH2_9CAUD|nr:deoxynucleoside monophosphate kinase [Arthrobacter phage Adumb2043]QOP65084.1 deoxynucleoside monophosphate kinase [Arthrobacter phage Adumb2043]